MSSLLALLGCIALSFSGRGRYWVACLICVRLQRWGLHGPIRVQSQARVRKGREDAALGSALGGCIGRSVSGRRRCGVAWLDLYSVAGAAELRYSIRPPPRAAAQAGPAPFRARFFLCARSRETSLSSPHAHPSSCGGTKAVPPPLVLSCTLIICLLSPWPCHAPRIQTGTSRAAFPALLWSA